METPNLGFVGVFDVDGTLMTKAMQNGTAQPEALAAAHYVRDYVDERGTFTVATAQTAEMLMSSELYENSRERGFARLPPKLGGESGRRFYVKPESIAARVPFTDAAAIMSMGTGCHIREADEWYSEAASYKRRLGLTWRENAMNLLSIIATESDEYKRYLAPIESEENYRQGVTDVMPLEYRIQFNFDDRESKDRMKYRIASALTSIRQILPLKGLFEEGMEKAGNAQLFGDIHKNLQIVDESSPALGKFQFYIMPRYAAKEEMVDEMLAILPKGEMIEDLVIAGDMPPDLRAGCYAGRARRATFILVGGSPLAPHFTRDGEHFGKHYAGESLEFVTKNLEPTGRPGFEILVRAGVHMRLFVNGDVAYPGLTGPETIAAFLKDDKVPMLY